MVTRRRASAAPSGSPTSQDSMFKTCVRHVLHAAALPGHPVVLGPRLEKDSAPRLLYNYTI
eukprot:2890175-Pyramimonas_sp.AAC.1